jgi:predicted O-linked N-acetylglucosamine transferase (SPINDLY family)
MMGVTDTLANSVDEYIAIATRLGLDSAYRRKISEKIAKHKTQVFHDRACISALEEFFEKEVRARSSIIHE